MSKKQDDVVQALTLEDAVRKLRQLYREQDERERRLCTQNHDLLPEEKLDGGTFHDDPGVP